MKNKNLNTILFNAAGVGLVLFLGAYMVNSALRREKIPQCSARYGDGQQFSLQNNDGAMMSPIELQARLPNREWGLLQNARVVGDKSGAFLQVALGPHEGAEQAAAEAEAGDDETKQNDGVGFVWQPQTLTSARAACLSYRVFLSKDFSFDQKGKLPALYALKDPADLDATQPEGGFVTRLGWDKGGMAGLSIKTPLSPGTWMSTRNFFWPVNRWVSVEQEVVLNSPDKSDGLVRVWVDGQLKIENTGFNLGAKQETTLSGVVADVGFESQVSKVGRVTLSPFIVQGR